MHLIHVLRWVFCYSSLRHVNVLIILVSTLWHPVGEISRMNVTFFRLQGPFSCVESLWKFYEKIEFVVGISPDRKEDCTFCERPSILGFKRVTERVHIQIDTISCRRLGWKWRSERLGLHGEKLLILFSRKQRKVQITLTLLIWLTSPARDTENKDSFSHNF